MSNVAKPYLIATPRVGLERDMEPEWIPEDAFPNLEDCYMFRGRVQRRKGLLSLGRLVTTVGGVDTFNNQPVMGLRNRELTTINVEQLIAFDTIKANAFSNTTQLFTDISFYKTSGTAFSWTGTNSDFFWTVNYLNAFWATNHVRGFQSTPTATIPGSGDGIRWYDGTGWINFLPQVDGTNFLMGSLLIVTYRNRLVMLNTTEGTAIGAFTNFPQRARWSQNGTPYYDANVPAGYTGGNNADAWRSDLVGRGGFIDAPTSEQIISAEFYKDTLVVFFERSTWQLRYTGNETLPFIWERINVELGAESTFSIVPFDSGMVAVGNYGIVSCDATGVKRIDQIIPDEVFDFHNGNDGPKRVYGIRDYSQQLVYWTFPNADNNPTFPNRVLVYNYIDGSYAFFNDSLTCFGTYQSSNDVTWANLPVPWQSYIQPWNSGELQSDFPLIVAGNQQGFVFTNYNAAFIINPPSLFLTNITQANPAVVTSPNHNLKSGQVILISGVVGMTQVNGNFYQVNSPTTNSFSLKQLVNGNWVNVDSTTFTPYASGGFITVHNNFNITTKKFNPFLQDGDQLRLQSVDLFLEEATSTEFTMNVFLDDNDNEAVQTTVVPFSSQVGSKVWFRNYTSVIGQFVQLEMFFDDEQMVDTNLSSGDVVIHAMMLWMTTSGRLTYGTFT